MINHPGNVPHNAALGESAESAELSKADLIVEKMHIHHGMQSSNPVSRLRFYPKGISGEHAIGRMVDERHFETALPSSFEHFGVRIFCRFRAKEERAKQAFKEWYSSVMATQAPTLSMDASGSK